MSYCTRCGAYIPEGERVCQACGYDGTAQKSGAEESAREDWSRAGAAQQQYTDTSKDPWESKKRVREPWEQGEDWKPWLRGSRTERQGGSAPSGGQTGDERRLSVLSYVGPLFLLPLLLRRNDPFVRFHANQGLVLFLLECLLGTVLGDGLLALAGWIFCLYCLVQGAKNVAAGRMTPLPLIGGIQLLK